MTPVDDEVRGELVELEVGDVDRDDSASKSRTHMRSSSSARRRFSTTTRTFVALDAWLLSSFGATAEQR